MSVFVLLLLTLFVLRELATASPQLRSRDENPASWLNLLEQGVNGIESLPDLLETPEPTTPAPGLQNKLFPAAPNSNILPSDRYKVQLDHDQQVTTNDCNPKSSTSSSSACRQATSQIIYPRKCAQNDALTAALNKLIRPRVVKSFIDNSCGVSFYSASLTGMQKSKIREMVGVKSVATNMKIKRPRILRNSNPRRASKNRKSADMDIDHSLKSDQEANEEILNPDGENPEPNDESDFNTFAASSDSVASSDFVASSDSLTSSDSINKRSGVDYVLERPDEVIGNLAFISTPVSRKSLKQYHSFRTSGHSTRLYLMCEGVDSTHRTFFRTPFDQRPDGTSNGRSEGVIIKQITTTAASPFGVIDENYADGTCAASISIGDPFGVALYPDLVVVKLGFTIQSFMEGWLEIINDLELSGRLYPSKPLIGYTVIETHHYWYRGLDLPMEVQLDLMAHEEQLKLYLSTLINKWQVVVVVPASGESQGRLATINHFPAVLSTDPEFPIIVVGAVNRDGSAPAWSPGGSALTVSAPGIAGCAWLNGADELESAGVTLATAHVAGLALYLLSLPGLGSKIRETNTVAKTLRDFILYKAYSRRDGSPVAIWNGLDPYSPGDYGWTYMDFFQRREKS